MFDSPDIDRIVERHDSGYINGIKHMFWSGNFYDPPEDESEEPDDIEVEYVDANGQTWYVYLTATEKAQLDAMTSFEERLKFLEDL